MTAATAKDTCNWMKEKGYEVMWIIPEMDISPDHVTSAEPSNRPNKIDY